MNAMNIAGTAPGLVVLLEAAGRSIAGLEVRVVELEGMVRAEREGRGRAEDLLAALRATAPPDTAPSPPRE